MLNDFSYAFRTLRKSPIFTITVVVTIALAIGASTAIFSVTNGVLLQEARQRNLHQRDEANGLARDSGSGADALFAPVDRSFLDDRRVACGRAFVRRAGYVRPPTNRGDWSSHGIRRRAVTHLSFDGRQGPLAQRDWHRDRPHRVVYLYANPCHHACRSQTDGSCNVCLSRRALPGHCVSGFVATGRSSCGLGSDHRIEE